MERQPAGVPLVAPDSDLQVQLGGISRRTLQHALRRIETLGLGTYTRHRTGPHGRTEQLRRITPDWHALHDAPDAWKHDSCGDPDLDANGDHYLTCGANNPEAVAP